jgi:subtilisin family serine protease
MYMSELHESQFRAMQAAFARQGAGIEVAYALNGRPDYIYQVGRLLVDVRVQGLLGVLEGVLPGIEVADKGEQPLGDSLRVYSIESVHNRLGEPVYVSVPEALDLIDAYLREHPLLRKYPGEGGEELARSGDYSPVTPLHVLHITQDTGNGAGRVCPATEPEVPCSCPPGATCPQGPPYPPQATGNAGANVLIGVCDTGLLTWNGPVAPWPWLQSVHGDPDPLGPVLASVPPIPPGLHAIPQYTGHGTFVAGVARCQAPGADVQVAGDVVTGGGVLETTIVAKLMNLLASFPAVRVVNLSSGGYTRHDFVPLSFTVLNLDKIYGNVPLVAAAGNDATHRKFWPAAFHWVVGVGALGADQRDRAWFSNYGHWVNVYALGEGVVNAFATGVYTYQEPPKRPHQQIFDGMARWSGTSFSAPLVAGQIAAMMTTATGGLVSAVQAKDDVLQLAGQQAIPGVGPALYPWHS